ncbi:uncharacterized protein N7483_003591 [Penicillium malachiteum]|uniref:uncharacterized protein n=1 Tax=Penicillium malachiteum TaxID=1324776 RepID=UPI002548B78C|nr:uncharacterized protein N7483_003591 [Penicillium malachiteum]KAJ5729083.1 hypothetical protein N7483_003591 [Penicillium malachiteum]
MPDRGDAKPEWAPHGRTLNRKQGAAENGGALVKPTYPTIKYEYGLDGQTEYAYTANNQKDFSFGSSPTIDSVGDSICNRLRSPCNAPQETIDQCYAAQSAVSGLSGQEAADTWNKLMG